MDMKLELIGIPVTDIDRAKAFYEQVGFNADHDHTVSDEIRFVQMTPPGSACSIAFGSGITEAGAAPVLGLQVVVASAEATRADLARARHRGQRDPGLPLGPVRLLPRPGRQPLGRAGDPEAGVIRVLTTTPRTRPVASGGPRAWSDQ